MVRNPESVRQSTAHREPDSSVGDVAILDNRVSRVVDSLENSAIGRVVKDLERNQDLFRAAIGPLNNIGWRKTIDSVSSDQSEWTRVTRGIAELNSSVGALQLDKLNRIAENFAPMAGMLDRYTAEMNASVGVLQFDKRHRIAEIVAPLAGIVDRYTEQFALVQKTIGAIELNSRFKLPELDELARISARFRVSPLAGVLDRYAEQFENVRKSMEAIRTPWLDSVNVLHSLEGFAALQGIGDAVQRASAFEYEVAAALRADLGDWRDTLTLPQHAISDLVVRSEFYADLGFNRNLTNFPLPAFDNALEIAGLREEPVHHVRSYDDHPFAPHTPEARR